MKEQPENSEKDLLKLTLEKDMKEFPKEDLLRQLEERLLQPNLRKSSQDIADFLADEFFEIGSSGRVYSKPQVIEILQHEPTNKMSIMDFRAMTLALGVVLTTYQVVWHGSLKEEMTHSWRSSIWKLLEGQWKMVFHQGTLLEGP